MSLTFGAISGDPFALLFLVLLLLELFGSTWASLAWASLGRYPLAHLGPLLAHLGGLLGHLGGPWAVLGWSLAGVTLIQDEYFVVVIVWTARQPVSY